MTAILNGALSQKRGREAEDVPPSLERLSMRTSLLSCRTVAVEVDRQRHLDALVAILDGLVDVDIALFVAFIVATADFVSARFRCSRADTVADTAVAFGLLELG